MDDSSFKSTRVRWNKGTQRENSTKILEMSFPVFLDRFGAFKRNICVSSYGLNCSGSLAENLHFKLQETECCTPNFSATAGSPKMLADLISQSRRNICLSKNNRID